MRRGSVSTWENFGRRSSASMSQFTGGPAQFMTTDDIKYRRTDGCFLSYKKAAIFLPIFILGLIAAGLIGWYCHSVPRSRIRDALSLLNEDDTLEKSFVSNPLPSHVQPIKYWLRLKPVFMDNQSVSLRGQAVIEFRIDEFDRSKKLFLNAINITTTKYELTFLREKPSTKRQKRSEGADSPDKTSNESNNSAILYDTMNDNLSSNETLIISNDTSSQPEIKKDSFPEEKMVNNANSGNELIRIKRYEVDRANGIHVVHTSRELEAGSYSLKIDYVASDPKDAIYVANRSNREDGKWMMGTQSKSQTSKFFPVLGEINRKVIFSLSIERPEEMTVLSNMPLRNTKDASDNSVIDTFDDTPPIASYNLAFVIGHLEIVNKTTLNSRISLTFWSKLKTSSQEFYLLEKVEPILQGLSDALSLSYALPKLDLVCLPTRTTKRVSGRPGLISMRESLFYTDDQSPILAKMEALRSLIGLLAEEQSWLDAENWKDAWVVEGSSIYSQDRLLDQIDSSLEHEHSFVADVQADAMEADGYSISRSFRMKTNQLRVLSLKERNARGACLIRMLHGVVNNETAFGIAYGKFVTSRENGNSTVEDFWASLDETAKDLPDKSMINEIMDPWISRNGYPLINVQRNYEDGSAVVKQKGFFYDKPSSETNALWYVPLTYIKSNEDWSNPTKAWLKQESNKVVYNVGKIGEGSEINWILFNVNKTGYYRVNYDPTNWQLLATALMENHEAFPPETRASLVDDVFALSALGAAKYETAFGFIKYMQMKERHYAPWSTFARHVLKLYNVLYETPVFLDFQEFLQQFVTPLYEQVSTSVKEGSPLTLTAIKLGCLSEYPDCLDWAKDTFLLSKRDRNFRRTIPSYIREVLYCTIAKHGGREEWNYLFRKMKNTAKTEEKQSLLSSFGCFQSPGILNTILDDILHGDTYDEVETQQILKSFSVNAIASRVISQFVRSNWTSIVERFSASLLTTRSFILAMENSVTSERDLQDLHAFWENNLESVKNVKHAAASIEAKVQLSRSLIQNYSQDIRDWLTKHRDGTGK